jgi:hypothetical protein
LIDACFRKDFSAACHLIDRGAKVNVEFRATSPRVSKDMDYAYFTGRGVRPIGMPNLLSFIRSRSGRLYSLGFSPELLCPGYSSSAPELSRYTRRGNIRLTWLDRYLLLGTMQGVASGTTSPTLSR